MTTNHSEQCLRIASRAALLILVCHAWFSVAVEAHAFHVDHTDEELDVMNIENLLHVERDLRAQNSFVDGRLAALKAQMAELHVLRKHLEKSNKDMQDAKNWETRQKQSRIRELAKEKEELESKREQMKLLRVAADKLHHDIAILKQKLQALDVEDKERRKQYDKPPLRDSVLREAERAGPIAQHLINKSLESIIPELKYGLSEVEMVQDLLESSGGLTYLISTMWIYAFAIGTFYILYRSLRKMQGVMTLPRLLFSVDMMFSAVWLSIIGCYVVMLEDPLYEMAVRHVALSIVVQMTLLVFAAANVLMRCYYISMSMQVCAVGELICTVYIAQDYYQNIWIPFVLDQEFKSSLFTYFEFAVINGWLAIYRARSMAHWCKDLEKQNAEELWFKSSGWLRTKITRVLQFCEDVLTTGMAESNEEEQCFGSCSQHRAY